MFFGWMFVYMNVHLDECSFGCKYLAMHLNMCECMYIFMRARYIYVCVCVCVCECVWYICVCGTFVRVVHLCVWYICVCVYGLLACVYGIYGCFVCIFMSTLFKMSFWKRKGKWHEKREKHFKRRTNASQWSCQGILKGEVSLYSWPSLRLVWNQLYDNWQFMFLFAKQTNPNQSYRR